MIVPEFNADVMSGYEHDFDSLPYVYTGDVRCVGDGKREGLVNPRPIGFGSGDPFYVPVYWDES